MNKSTLKFIFIFCFGISALQPIHGFGQTVETADTSNQSIENYREQIRRLVGFLEFSLNTLGSSETSTKDKETIINESYQKAFLNEKVQVEDDLDENREILTYKDIQAYLKDVDFFFREAVFNFSVQDIQSLKNDQGMTYFKVTANRNLQAVTLQDSVVNNNNTRYIEINVDEEEQVLKIASIYTTRLNEAQELMTWWNGMPAEWKNILGPEYTIFQDIKLNQVDFLNDTTLLFVHEVPQIIEYESFLYIGDDSLLVMESDTILVESYDTIPAGNNGSIRILKDITKTESLDVSGNLTIYDLYPVDQMTDLKSLNISGTLISDLFPARNLNRLETLDISGTFISDLSPIQYNTKIRELNIDSSSVSSLAPIKGFAALEVLHFRSTLVDSIYDIKFLGNIKDLRMNNSPVSDLTPLGDLINLETLSISGTLVQDLTPLQYLLSLKKINFENTGISDLTALSRLENLQIIDADMSRISDLAPLGDLPALEKIYCNKTLITRIIANAFMSTHPSVLVIYESEELSSWWAALDLDWQSVFKSYTTLDEVPTTEQLHKLSLVSSIDIAGNGNIISLKPLAKLSNLKEIRAGRTMISDIEPLSELMDLTLLSIPETRISSLTALSSLKNLENLDLSGTLIDSLNGLENHDHLQILNLDHTGIDDLRPLSGCREISIVYCDNTRIGTLDIDRFIESHPDCLIIYQTSLLRNWWLALPAPWKSAFRIHTELDESPTREQLHILAGLDSLDLSGKRELSSLQPLTTLKRLVQLSLANCNLQDISPLSNLNKLSKLNLSGNNVEDLTPVSSLPSLVILDISNTPVSKLDALEPLVSLEYLNCSGTQIKKLDPLSGLAKLKKLECYNTGINNLKPLTGLVQLKQLICYNTNLSAKKVAAFKETAPDIDVVFY
jgi:Leucine-rich repeat (LRR) protein